MREKHWNGHDIELARTEGGVYAFRTPWDGLVRGDVTPWPPPELVQKLYQSRQVRAFRDSNLSTATAVHGYYSDLQSVHSEDAITWSLFGPLCYERAEIKDAYTAELFRTIGVSDAEPESAHMWLWRRLPHPDSLVPGGPEIDFGLQTRRILVLGEAKWRSAIGVAQGADRNKDQIQLRVEFCEKYGKLLFPEVERFVVLLVGQAVGTLGGEKRERADDLVSVLETTWQQLGDLASNPWRDEFLAQLDWRRRHSSP